MLRIFASFISNLSKGNMSTYNFGRSYNLGIEKYSIASERSVKGCLFLIIFCQNILHRESRKNYKQEQRSLRCENGHK